MDTLSFAKTLGEVFHARADENPIVNMKIEGSDPLITPYASCRAEELSLHTDYATFLNPPRFTITHCLEPDPKFPHLGKSIVVELDPVLVHLREQEPFLDKFLRERRVPFQRNAEHNSYHSDVPTFSVLDQDLVRFDSTLILPHLERSATENDFQSAKAIRQFEMLCHKLGRRSEIALDRMEVLIIDNRRLVHSRGPCSIRYVGEHPVSREVNLAFLV
jgi:alpha-ketoglutarate-dependent taurine dioxygenase